MLYNDSLISITDKEIIFKHYYFPTGKSKIVRFRDIESITVKPSTIANGKWRLHGTGNIKIWFPRDMKRFKRDKIFFVELKTQWIDIGFTVEDTDLVVKILGEKQLLKIL